MKKTALSFQLSALGFFLAACSLPSPQADPVRHFTLSGPVASAAGGAVVRPVQLAGHLRNRAMAVRVGPNEVIYDENIRWAEALDGAITQVLRARVGPVGAGSVITVQIQRCELVRSENNTVQLAATWAILPGKGEARHGSFSASPRSWDGRDAAALVGLVRDAVTELGDALAAEAK